MTFLYLFLLLRPILEIDIEPDFNPQRFISVRDRIILFDPTKTYLLTLNPEDFAIDSLFLEGLTKNILSIASDGLKIYVLTVDKILLYDWNGGFLGKESISSYIDFDLFPPDAFFFIERTGNYLIIKSGKDVSKEELSMKGESVRYIENSRYVVFGKDGIEIFETPGVSLNKLKILVKDVFHHNEKVILLGDRKIYEWDFEGDELKSIEINDEFSSIFVYREKLLLGKRGKIEVYNLTTLFSSPTR